MIQGSAGRATMTKADVIALFDRINGAAHANASTRLSARQVKWLAGYLDFVGNDFPPTYCGLTAAHP